MICVWRDTLRTIVNESLSGQIRCLHGVLDAWRVMLFTPSLERTIGEGCGLCEYRCHSAWVSQQKLLPRSAVVVQAP